MTIHEEDDDGSDEDMEELMRENEEDQRQSKRLAYDKIGDTEIITALRDDDGMTYFRTEAFGGDAAGTIEINLTVDGALDEHRQMVEFIRAYKRSPIN